MPNASANSSGNIDVSMVIFWLDVGDYVDCTSVLKSQPACNVLLTGRSCCRFVPLKTGFSAKNVREYVEDIRRGALSGVPLFGALAEAATIDAWDGKDGKLVEEDEFDLDDLMKEEL